MRQQLYHSLDSQGRHPRRNLLELPSILYRQTKASGYRRPRGEIPQEVRQGGNCQDMSSPRITRINMDVQPPHGAGALSCSLAYNRFVRKFWDNSSDVGAGVPARAEHMPVPQSVRFGTVTISPATVLAPMAGVTDTVFRRFIRNLGGCGLIMTEFTSADGVLRAKDKKAQRYLHFYEDEHPISAQLFGSDPRVMAEASRMVEGLGFDLVDLNLGCPAKKVVKCNGGAGLLRDLPAIRRIFEAVRAAVKIPFTVKFRAGWDEHEIVGVELAKMAEDCGLCAVALHARTREQGSSGNARWEWIGAVKHAVKIPVIGNGDIRSPQDACGMVAQTGCDAVMIGRTAASKPWIFRQIAQFCDRVGPDVPVWAAERSSAGKP